MPETFWDYARRNSAFYNRPGFGVKTEAPPPPPEVKKSKAIHYLSEPVQALNQFKGRTYSRAVGGVAFLSRMIGKNDLADSMEEEYGLSELLTEGANPRSPDAPMGAKMLGDVAAGSQDMAVQVVASALGAVAKVPPKLTFAFTAGLQELGPSYMEAKRRNIELGDSVEDANKKAVQEAAIDFGIVAGSNYLLPGSTIFGKAKPLLKSSGIGAKWARIIKKGLKTGAAESVQETIAEEITQDAVSVVMRGPEGDEALKLQMIEALTSLDDKHGGAEYREKLLRTAVSSFVVGGLAGGSQEAFQLATTMRDVADAVGADDKTKEAINTIIAEYEPPPTGIGASSPATDAEFSVEQQLPGVALPEAAEQQQQQQLPPAEPGLPPTQQQKALPPGPTEEEVYREENTRALSSIAGEDASRRRERLDALAGRSEQIEGLSRELAGQRSEVESRQAAFNEFKAKAAEEIGETRAGRYKLVRLPSRKDQKVAMDVARKLGLNLFFFEGDTALSGWRSASEPGTIGINAATKGDKQIFSLIGHELSHNIEQSPEFQEFVSWMETSNRANLEKSAKRYHKKTGIKTPFGEWYGSPEGRSEAVAAWVQEYVGRTDMWAELSDENPGVFEQVTSTLRNSLMGILTPDTHAAVKKLTGVLNSAMDSSAKKSTDADRLGLTFVREGDESQYVYRVMQGGAQVGEARLIGDLIGTIQVEPSARGKGVGTAILREMIRLGGRHGFEGSAGGESIMKRVGMVQDRPGHFVVNAEQESGQFARGKNRAVAQPGTTVVGLPIVPKRHRGKVIAVKEAALGHAPRMLIHLDLRRVGKIDSMEDQRRENEIQLIDEMKKAWGEPTQVQLEWVDTALGGESKANVDAAMAQLQKHHPNIARVVKRQRDHVDQLTDAAIATDVMSPEEEIVATANRGYYKRRSYEIFLTKDQRRYVDSLPRHVIEDAARLIQKIYAKNNQPRGRQLAVPGQTPVAKTMTLEDAVAKVYEQLGEIRGQSMRGWIASADPGKLDPIDLRVLMQKQDIPSVFRRLFGEIKDPVTNYQRTVLGLAEVIAGHEMLVDFIEAADGTYVWHRDDPDKPKDVELTPIGAKQPQDSLANWGPLVGYVTHPEIAHSMGLLWNPKTTDGFVKHWMKFVVATKAAATTMNMKTGARNYGSNYIFMLANGYTEMLYPSEKMILYHKAAFGDLMPRAVQDPEANALRRRVKAAGALPPSAMAGEITASKRDAFDKASKLNYPMDLAAKGYQFGDNVFKIAMFDQEVARYNKHRVAQKKGWTQEQLEKYIGYMVRQLHPTYALAPKFVQQMRKFALGADFPAFWAESIRTFYNGVMWGVHEARDPDTRVIGLTRLSGHAISLSLMPMLAYALSAAWGNGDDKVREMAAKAIGSKYRYGNSLWITKVTEAGLKYNDLTYWDPRQAIVKPSMILAGANMPEMDFRDRLVLALQEFFSPLVSTRMSTEAVVQAMANSDDFGNKIRNQQDLLSKQFTDTMVHLVTPLIPGTAKDIGKVSEGKHDRRSVVFGMLTGMDFRTDNWDKLANSLGYTARNDFADATKIYTRVLKDSDSGITYEDIEAAYVASNERHMELVDQFYQRAEALMYFGMTQKDLRVRLTKVTGLTRQQAYMVTTGNYIPFGPKDVSNQQIRDTMTAGRLAPEVWRQRQQWANEIAMKYRARPADAE